MVSYKILVWKKNAICPYVDQREEPNNLPWGCCGINWACLVLLDCLGWRELVSVCSGADIGSKQIDR